MRSGSFELVIYNGYQKSQAAFNDNSRVKKMKISLDGNFVGYLSLNDLPGRQYFDLTQFGVKNYSIIRFEIVEVYQGTKWKDTAISEIFFRGG